MNLINTLKLHMAGHKYLPSERVTSFFFLNFYLSYAWKKIG